MWTHGVDISHVLVLTNVALICDHDGDDFKAYQMGQFQACWWLSDQPPETSSPTRVDHCSTGGHQYIYIYDPCILYIH